MYRFLIFTFLSLFSTAALALPAAINSPKQIGSANFSLLGIPLYSAALFTENGTAYSANNPFILELVYKRSISKEKLIEATIDEMNRISGGTGGADGQLASCFRDVSSGDRFAAVNLGANTVGLYFNNAKTCTLKGSGMSKRFFNIWLSDSSRAPKLSKALRGGK